MQTALSTNIQEISQETLDSIKEAQLGKAITSATGLQGYDLSDVVLAQVPILTPIRNEIPRSKGASSLAAHWKSITSVTRGTHSPFVAEGVRNSEISYTVTDYTATHKTLGHDDSITQEAEWASVGFDDARAESTFWLMQMCFMSEEDAFLGGNGNNAASLNFSSVATPTLSTATTGGTIADATYKVYVVALTYLGYQLATKTGTLALPTAVNGTMSNKSSVATQATSGGNLSTLSGYTTAINGAVAYAWFVGTVGNEKLEAITTLNSFKLTALAGTGQAATAVTANISQDSAAFDGIITQVVGGSGVIQVQATGTPGVGTTLTSDGAGGIVEVDNMLKSMWDTMRLGPTKILISSQEALGMNRVVVAGGGTPLFRFNIEMGSDGQSHVAAASLVSSYLNKFTGRPVPVQIHPTMPPGTMLFWTNELPIWYPRTTARVAWDFHFLQNYMEVTYGMTTRKNEHGVYEMGVLRGFINAAQGLLTNIAPPA